MAAVDRTVVKLAGMDLGSWPDCADWDRGRGDFAARQRTSHGRRNQDHVASLDFPVLAVGLEHSNPQWVGSDLGNQAEIVSNCEIDLVETFDGVDRFERT